MYFTKALKRFIDPLPEKYRLYKINIGEKRNIKKHQSEWDSVNWTESQINEYNDFWQKAYGSSFSPKWAKLYQSANGVFHKDYFPEILYTTKLETLLCPREYRTAFADKTLLNTLFSNVEGVTLPHTYGIGVNGMIYDENAEILSKEILAKRLASVGDIVLKPTKKTSSGRGVIVCSIENGVSDDGTSIKELLDKCGDDFVLQEKVKPCDEFSKVYQNSVNTIRVITYLTDKGVFHVPLAMRIGRNGKRVDNIHAGGLVVGVCDDGTLRKTAFDWFNVKYTSHPDTNMVFEGYVLPSIKKVIEGAYKLHMKIPQVRIVSWDFTVNDKHEAVLIEANLENQSIWFPQIVNALPAFGDNTEYMLGVIKRSERN